MNDLDRAIDRLRGRWCQLSWLEDDGRVCANGAIRESLREQYGEVDVDRYRELKILLARTLIDEGLLPWWSGEPNGGTVLCFNDAGTTTEEDVLLAMKHASVRLDEREVAS